MTTRTALVLLQPVAVVAVVLVAFAFLNAPFRQAEATAAVELLHLLGASPDRVQVRPESSVAVFTEGLGAFLAVVTPSCSSLASLLAVATLALFTPRVGTPRLVGAIGAAVLCVVLGNVVRIAASLGIGLVSGTGSLVLFHDWVGSLFAFAYTLGGYLLMLRILLPARRPAAAARPALPRPLEAARA